MRVGVRFVEINSGGVRVLVMLVMNVGVRMFERLVMVQMFVALGQEKVNFSRIYPTAV